MFVHSGSLRLTELQDHAIAPSVTMLSILESVPSALPLTHVIVWAVVFWPTMTMHNMGPRDFCNHLTGFWEHSRADGTGLIRKAIQVMYQIMRGNDYDLTFTYSCSLWGF